MKYFYALACASLCLCVNLSAQLPDITFPSFNMTLQQHLAPAQQGAFYNDCWGWTDPDDGQEYAIFGSLENVYFVNITNSESLDTIQPIFTYDATVSVTGPLGLGSVELTPEYILTTSDTLVAANTLSDAANVPSLWRDFKTYGDYAYGVVDLGTGTTSEEGLLVFDLSDLPNSITFDKQLSTPADEGDYFELAHNLYVDEQNAKLYAVGVRGNADVKIYDVSGENGATPKLIRAIDFDSYDFIPEGMSGYVHDIFVENNIAYCSHINTGEWAIWNLNGIEDPNKDPLLVGVVNSGHLQHNSWPTNDRTAFVFCEETPDEPIGFVDISGVDYNSNLNNIEITYLFRDPLLEPGGETDNIAHNAFIRGNYLYISYYEDGVQVFDLEGVDFSKENPLASSIVERVETPTRVAYLDTSPETTYNEETGVNTLPYGTRLPTWNNWGVYPFYQSNKIIASDTEYGLFIMTIDDGSDGNDALAVDLATFTAQPNQNRVRLDWSTESELDHAGFTIERSATGKDNSWEALMEVKAKGNVTNQMLYTEYDENPINGTNYYRLKMHGLDKKTSYSQIIIIDFINTELEVKVSPTLATAKDEINIELQNAVVSTLAVQIVNMKGQVISKEQLSSADGINFKVMTTDLPKGNYILSMNGGNVSATQRISIVK